MTVNISSNANGFKTCSYALSALPLIPYMKLDGFDKDGIQWDDIEIATMDVGADGLATVNQKPVLYVCTISLKPNSPCRNILDTLVSTLTPVYGKTLSSAGIELIETNELTGFTYVYTGGAITNAPGGNNNNMDEGQGKKVYKITFSNKAPLPL